MASKSKPNSRVRKHSVKLSNYLVPDAPQSAREKEVILAELPRDTRIYVKEEDGNLRYKELPQVLDTDTLLFKKNGDPVVMRGRPGRAAEDRVQLEAANKEVAEINRQRGEYLSQDGLVKAARINSDSPDVLTETIVRLTEVASTLAFERQEAHRTGTPTSMIARREVAALVAIRDASLKRIDQRLRKQEIDLESLAFRNLFVYMVRTFTAAMDAIGIPAQEIDSVVSYISKEVDTAEWKNSALRSMLGNSSVH